jgi:hypothetical protein
MPTACGEARPVAALEIVEARGSTSAREDLARPVGAEVGEEEPVAVGHARIVPNDRGTDEFIGLAAVIGRGDGGVGGREGFPRGA